MAQAIDIDIDDANRLPTHWLHAAYAGADAPALIAARKAEVAGLFLGDATGASATFAPSTHARAQSHRSCAEMGTRRSPSDLSVPQARAT